MKMADRRKKIKLYRSCSRFCVDGESSVWKRFLGLFPLLFDETHMKRTLTGANLRHIIKAVMSGKGEKE